MACVECAFCDDPVAGTDFLRCVGPCGRPFHPNCTGLNKAHIKCLIECQNLCYKCEVCRTQCYKPLEDKVDKMAQQLADMKGTIDKILLDKVLVNTVQRVPILTQPTPTTSKEIPQRSSPKKKVVREVIHGTGPRAGSAVTVAAPKYWVHLSGLEPDTEEEALVDLLTSNFDTDQIKCIKLAPKNRPLSQCDSISFKIGFPKEFEAEALDASNWPEGFAVPQQKHQRMFRGMQTPSRKFTPFGHDRNRWQPQTPFSRNRRPRQQWDRYDGYDRRSGRY
jgi:hypothetical protein